MDSSQNQQLLEQLEGSVKLLTMMPPSKIKKNLVGLVNIAPNIEDYLYEKVELPMEINSSGSAPFLQTELNRDGDNFRSPFDQKYYPETQQSAYFPSGQFKKFQEMGNLLFLQYTKLYYGKEGFGSFYVLENDQDSNKFSCGYFAKKICPQQSNQNGFQGEWNSFNIVDVNVKNNIANYKLTSTVMLEMNISNKSNGNLDLTGFQKNSKVVEKTIKIGQDNLMEYHLITIGQMIQDIETQIRQQMEAVYIAKTRQIVFTTRYQQTKEVETSKYKLAQELKSIRFSKQ